MSVTQRREQRYEKNGSNGHIPTYEVSPLEAFDLVDVLQEEYEPLQWIIPDYLPEGLTLLFSRPKVGKSMLSLALSLRMAKRVSGGIDGKVLYLTLDDTNKRRLQSRTRSLLQGEEIERSRVWASTQSQTLDTGLIDQLSLWMRSHPTTRLIVIDVYARIKPKKQDDDIYKSDYDALCKLQEFAVKHHTAIILVHHTRKQKDTEDWIDNVNGSTGLTAAVDTIWMLERKARSNNLTLRVKGRDTIGELEIGLTLDDLDAPWELDGEEDEQEVNASRQKILDALNGTDNALTPKRIAEITALKHTTVLGTLRRMFHKNLISQTVYGSYKNYRITELHQGNACNSVILAGECINEETLQAPSERITKNYKNGNNHHVVILEDQKPSAPDRFLHTLPCGSCNTTNWYFVDDHSNKQKCRTCEEHGQDEPAQPQEQHTPAARFGEPAPKECLRYPKEHGFTRVRSPHTGIWEPCSICESEYEQKSERASNGQA